MTQDKDEKDEVVVKTITVPYWGDTHIRIMSGTQRDAHDRVYADENAVNYPYMRARMGAFSICDEHGNLLYTEDDIPALSERNGVALDFVFDQARELNGMGRKAAAALGKDSTDIPLDGPGSV